MNETIKAMEEFTIDNFSGYQFRFIKIKPTKILALTSMLGGESNFSQKEFVIDFALSNTEIKIDSVWNKVKDGDLFFPPILEERLDVMRQIVDKFTLNFLVPLFHKPAE